VYRVLKGLVFFLLVLLQLFFQLLFLVFQQGFFVEVQIEGLFQQIGLGDLFGQGPG
jgi:hypothetical protein